MDVVYSGEHSINFYKVTLTSTTKKNTWKDMHLIPTSRPSITYPSPNTRIVVIPGTSKRIDITDMHVGGLTYGPRTGSWEFYIDHDQSYDWRTAYNEVYNFVHGKELFVALDDEPTMFYNGVFSVSGYVAGSNYSTITIQYDLGCDSFIRKEVILGDGSVSLLNNCPIRFIGENGSPYAKDYGFTPETDYIIRINSQSKELELYDMTVLVDLGGE